MRLLNTKTLTFDEFYTDIPPYVILSHTWEEDEVTFQDMQNLETAKRKAGYAKVMNACKRARKYRFKWIWIDSCCINKDSSAELSEAINSMYQYYEDAVVCYVYLSDVSAEYHPWDPKSCFRTSRWFTRGWTLQELIAPEYVVFLDRNWTRIGTRWSERDVISAITSIPVEVFEGSQIDKYSVAQRMSWAALRETRRPEDQAYCLMGIFGVSMPPIYGEGGEKAFMRLQQEIIKISDDRSIFAWVASEVSEEEERGLLAKSPYEFRMSGEVKTSESDIIGKKSSYSFGNNGLRIHLPLTPTDEKGVFLASLHCNSEKDGSNISVYLREMNGQRYVRCRPHTLALAPNTSFTPESMQELIVKENPVPRKTGENRYKFRYAHVKLLPSTQDIVSTHSSEDTAYIKATGLEPVTLQYGLKATGEFFYIDLWQFRTPFMQFYYIHSLDPTSNSRMDMALWQLHNLHFPLPSYISVACEITSNYSQTIEIDYISKDIPHHDFLSEMLHRLNLNLGFMVPSNFRDYILHDMFPPDIFGRRFKNEAYVTVPRTDSGGRPNTFRVLAYCHSRYSSIIFYVALGLPSPSNPWVDIFWGDDLRTVANSSKSLQDIWKSYLDSGSRVQTRLNSQTSASTDLPPSLLKKRLIASVEKRANLQLGSHFLRLTDTKQTITFPEEQKSFP